MKLVDNSFENLVRIEQTILILNPFDVDTIGQVVVMTLNRVWDENGQSGEWSLDDHFNLILTPSQSRSVTIDIKPGSPENTVNLGSQGVTKVAILSTLDFDATTVDALSVELADAQVKVKGNGQPLTTIQDVNNDGFADLVLHMETEGFELTDGDTEATLTGETLDGEAIEGTDVVRVVP